MNISIEVNENNLLISIPIELLKFAAENHPEDPVLIKNENGFYREIASQLSHGLGDNETGLTGLQILLDKAIINVAENFDNAEFK